MVMEHPLLIQVFINTIIFVCLVLLKIKSMTIRQNSVTPEEMSGYKFEICCSEQFCHQQTVTVVKGHHFWTHSFPLCLLFFASTANFSHPLPFVFPSLFRLVQYGETHAHSSLVHTRVWVSRGTRFAWFKPFSLPSLSALRPASSIAGIHPPFEQQCSCAYQPS